MTWKDQIKEESVKVGLRREDALCQSKWSVIKWRKTDSYWVKVNPATLTCLGHYQILDIGLSFSLLCHWLLYVFIVLSPCIMSLVTFSVYFHVHYVTGYLM